MSNCPTCNSSILSQTPSLIGETQCTQNCPPETNCTDIYPAKCIYYSGSNLACTGINYGDSVDVALAKLDAKYGVRVNSTDTCCGYLADKIISDTLDITTETVDGCPKLKLEVSTVVSCRAYSDATLDLAWSNEDSLNPVQYSEATNCEVEFKGIAISTFVPGVIGNEFNRLVFTLPVGKRPSKKRVLSANVYLISDNITPVESIAPGLLTINTNGTVYFKMLNYDTQFCSIDLTTEPVSLTPSVCTFDLEAKVTLTLSFDGLFYTL